MEQMNLDKSIRLLVLVIKKKKIPPTIDNEPAHFKVACQPKIVNSSYKMVNQMTTRRPQVIPITNQVLGVCKN